MREESQYEALLGAYTERGYELLALQAEVEHLRRGIEAYRSRIAANTDEDLAVACREYQAWEREDGKRYER